MVVVAAAISSSSTYVQESLSNKAMAICQEIVAALNRWPLVRGSSKYIDSSSDKDLWPY